MPHRQYFRYVFRNPGVDGSTLTISVPAPGKGEQQHFQRFTLRNLTSANSDLLIGEKSGNVFDQLDIILDVAADVLGVVSNSEIIMQGTQRLELRLRGMTAGDNVTVTVEGYNWVRGQSGL